MSDVKLPTHSHAISALVQNETGTINRLVSMFRRRGISLASFNAGDCEQPGYSRLTITVNGDDSVLGQTIKQMEKLIDVVECQDLAPDDRVMREVALVSYYPSQISREAVLAVASEYEAKIEHDTENCLVLQYTGPVRLVEKYLEAMQTFPVREIVRSGPCVLKVSDQ